MSRRGPSHNAPARAQRLRLPVTIPAGVSGVVVGTLCVPEGAHTVQLLVHGFTFHDVVLKQTDTIEDALTYLPDYVLNASRAINLPVLTVNGQDEPFFCNGLLAGDCSSSEALASSERRFYGPDAVVDAIIVPGAGHHVTLERDAAQTDAAILGWIGARGF